MPDNDEDEDGCCCAWMDKAKAIALVIGAIATAIPGTIAATMGLLNHSKTEEISNRQQVNTQNIEKAMTSSANAEKAAQQTEVKITSVESAIMPK